MKIATCSFDAFFHSVVLFTNFEIDRAKNQSKKLHPEKSMIPKPKDDSDEDEYVGQRPQDLLSWSVECSQCTRVLIVGDNKGVCV